MSAERGGSNDALSIRGALSISRTRERLREALSAMSRSKQRLVWYQDAFLPPGPRVRHNRNWWEIKTLSGRRCASVLHTLAYTRTCAAHMEHPPLYNVDMHVIAWIACTCMHVGLTYMRNFFSEVSSLNFDSLTEVRLTVDSRTIGDSLMGNYSLECPSKKGWSELGSQRNITTAVRIWRKRGRVGGYSCLSSLLEEQTSCSRCISSAKRLISG